MASVTSLHSPSLPSHRSYPLLSSSLTPSFPPLSRTKPLSPSLKTSSPLTLKVLCMRQSRGGKKVARPELNPNFQSDPVYRNRTISLMINRILKDGKKSLAFSIVYRALKRIHERTGSNPLFVLRDAIYAVAPDVTVKSVRVGGSTLQIPIETEMEQGKALAIKWLLEAARKRQGRDMAFKLSNELMEAAKGSGEAVRKKESTHKMAEANRAFAHFR